MANLKQEVANACSKKDKVLQVLDALDAEDGADLLEALKDDKIQIQMIWRALYRRKISVSYSTLERYRKQKLWLKHG